MRRKQVLALLLSATIVAGNVLPAMAADIVSDENGNVVFVESTLKSEEDESAGEDEEEKCESSEVMDGVPSETENQNLELDSEKEKTDSSEENESVNEENALKKEAETVTSSVMSVQEKTLVMEDLVAGSEIKNINIPGTNYEANYCAYDDGDGVKLKLCAIDLHQNEYGEYEDVTNLEIKSSLEYNGKIYQIPIFETHLARLSACKNLTFEEGFTKIAIDSLYYLSLDKLNLPSSLNDWLFGTGCQDEDNVPYESFVDFEQQWTKEIAFPNGSAYYEIKEVNGEKRMYSKEKPITPDVNEQFTKYGIKYEVTEKDAKAKIVDFNGAEMRDGIVPSEIQYRGAAYQIESVAVDGAESFGNLTELTLSEGIKEFIVQSGYKENMTLKTLNLPASLEKLGYVRDGSGKDQYITYELHGLEEYNIAAGNKNYTSKDGVVYNKDQSELIYFPAGKKVDVFEVPSSVKTVAKSAFYYITGVKKLIIGEHVDYLAQGNAEYCEGMESLEISAKKIDPEVAYGCEGLKELKVSTNSYLDQNFGSNNRDLEHVYLDGVNNFHMMAFLHLYNMKEYHVTNSSKYYTKDGILYSGKTLSRYPAKKEAEIYVMPDDIVSSNSLAIEKPVYLKTVILSKDYELNNLLLVEPQNQIEVYFRNTKDLLLSDGRATRVIESDIGGNVYVPTQSVLDQINEWNTENSQYQLFTGVNVSVKRYPVSSIKVDKTNVEVKKGESQNVKLTFEPYYSTEEAVWTSENEEIATVSQDGTITGVHGGNTNIKVTMGDKTETIAVFVKEVSEIPLKSISLNKENGIINRGENDQLTVSYNPEDTTDSKDIVWETSNDKVVAVDAAGKVSAVGIGTATVTAKGANGTMDTCTYEVKAPLKAISVKEKTILNRGASEQLTVSYNPDDTTDSKNVTWSTSDKTVVTVDSTGKINAVGIGSATITVKGANGTKAECKVTVKAPLESIKMNKVSDTMNRGDKQTLKVTYNPDDTTDSKALVWTSSDSNIAVVDENGVVTAKNPGTVVIKAQGANNTETTCKITVKAPLESIDLNKENVTLNRGTNEKLNVTFNPTDTTDSKEVTWSTSDAEIVSVNEEGTIHAKGIGTATITVKGANGTKAECKVTVKAPLESIKMNKASDTMDRGSKQTLKVTYNPDDTTDSKALAWTSSDSNVATVNEKGVVTAKNPGTVIIKAQGANNTETTCKITVKAPLESIALNTETLSLIEEGSQKLNVIYNPTDTTDDKTVAWSSSNCEVATVDASGTVKAVKVGTATITAKVGNKVATCKVTVERKEVALESIALNLLSGTITVDESKQLLVSYNPTNTTVNRDVTWTTSDKNVVTVDANGLVKAVGAGKATVTAVVAGKKASCTFTVKAKEVALEGIALDKTALHMTEKDTEKLTVSYNPTNTTVDRTITWKSSNTDVATVKDGVVTAVKSGTATITAIVDGKKAECKVTVVRKEVALDSIKLDKTSMNGVIGDTEKLTVSYNPTNTTVDKTVAWTTSNEKVATVDANGNVSMIGAGEAVITATVAGKTATCNVNVKSNEIALENIVLDKDELTLDVTESSKLTVSYNPTNTTVDKTVVWTSSNEAVAVVDANGNVTAVSTGKATITATVAGKTATCEVTVKGKEVVVESIKLDKEKATAKKDETLQLTADVKANDEVKVIWMSSDESVATVDENGKVTMIGTGEVTITAKAGGKSATCVITVEADDDDNTDTNDDSTDNNGGNTGDNGNNGNSGNNDNQNNDGNQSNGGSQNNTGNQKPIVKPNDKVEDKGDDKAPQTSDPSAFGLWGTAMAFSGGILAKLRRRKKDEE